MRQPKPRVEYQPVRTSGKPFDLETAFRVPREPFGIELAITGAAVALFVYTAVSTIKWIRRKP